jgi:mRNA interferase MazF
MNGEILRGEVYWVCLDDSVGGEEKTGRPAVVVSANGVNDKQDAVVVAFISKQGFASATRPSIVDPKGERKRVLCDQLRTVDRSRLDRYMYTIEDSELIRVTGALASTLCIPTTMTQKNVAPAQNDELPALRAEIDMWKRMYSLVMDQLVEARVTAAVAERMRGEEKPVIKSGLKEPDLGYEESEEPKPTEKKKTSKKPGWDGVKVNINTVRTAKELKEKTGMSIKTANEIIATRKAVGNYEKVEDLLALEHFGNTSMKRYRHMLEV